MFSSHMVHTWSHVDHIWSRIIYLTSHIVVTISYYSEEIAYPLARAHEHDKDVHTKCILFLLKSLPKEQRYSLLLRTSLKKQKIAKSKFTCRKRTQRKLEKAQKSQRRSLQRPPSDVQNHHLGKRQHVHRMLQRDKKCLSGGASKDPRGLPKSASWAPRTCKITNVAPTCMPNASRRQKRLSGDLSRDPPRTPRITILAPRCLPMAVYIRKSTWTSFCFSWEASQRMKSNDFVKDVFKNSQIPKEPIYLAKRTPKWRSRTSRWDLESELEEA